ncbi:MAG: hypothetical protein ACXAE3_00685 [Candidatus Kariarchaeaceae archaeon]|jgi:hypothetical protein
MEWERKELRPLFDKLLSDATDWEPTKVMPRTQTLGTLVLNQLQEYKGGEYRSDRNEARGFFDAITRFVGTGLPLSLDHFEGLIKQYRDRISPYPHYSGIKITVPTNFKDLDTLTPEDVPDISDDAEDDDSSLTLL